MTHKTLSYHSLDHLTPKIRQIQFAYRTKTLRSDRTHGRVPMSDRNAYQMVNKERAVLGMSASVTIQEDTPKFSGHCTSYCFAENSLCYLNGRGKERMFPHANGVEVCFS